MIKTDSQVQRPVLRWPHRRRPARGYAAFPLTGKACLSPKEPNRISAGSVRRACGGGERQDHIRV